MQRKAEELTLRAPIAGTVIGPPEISHDHAHEYRLSNWNGSPLEQRNLGCWVESGTVLCTIGDPKHLDALVAIDQADVSEVQIGNPVRILLTSAPVRILTGTVVEVARRSTQRMQENPTLPAGKYHLVKVELSEQHSRLIVGSRGTAKIEAGSRTLGSSLSRSLQQMLRLPW